MKVCSFLKKLFSTGMCVALLVTVGCGDTKQKSDNKFMIGMVTDTGGLNDESFNQTTWKGCNACKDKLNADIKALESKRDEDYVPNLTRLAREPRDLIWATGFKFANSLPKIAKNFPKVKFGVIDTDLGGNIPKNVVAVTFKEEEAAFLIGVVAGLTTKTNQVGGIGGIYGELIEKFRQGYIKGVKAANPKAEVKWVYADSFTDSSKGRSLAKSMYNSGIDIIFHAAGGVGKGMFDEVKTKEVGKYWAIGVDQDQSRLAPNHTLTSLLKRLDVVVFDISKKLTEGEFKGGKEVQLGLKEDALDIVYSKWIRPDVKQKVEEYKEKIINGDITVLKNKGKLKQ